MRKQAAITLNTREETLAFLAAHDETFRIHETPVKSLWLCAELNRFGAEGYVYNSEAQARIIAENGLTKEMAERRRVPAPSIRTEGGLLGGLVYYAQQFRREMQLENDGWIRANQETLAQFVGGKCKALANGELAGEILAKVKRIGERLRLCPLRSRTKVYADYMDWWVKPIVPQS